VSSGVLIGVCDPTHKTWGERKRKIMVISFQNSNGRLSELVFRRPEPLIGRYLSTMILLPQSHR